MSQHDVHDALNTFFEKHVRLGPARRKKLASQRDACLDRLRTGLKLLGEKRGVTYRSFDRSIGQGSYAMSTLNQHPKDEYDIDEAVVFRADDLPASALEARKRVADALLEAGGNFLIEPEARTNAVTVWYADGSHVDLAVYRETQTLLGSKLEHAGADWRTRDPMAITRWFAKIVDAKSPGPLARVADGQLRRVVRWVKVFARSRASWNLPGGMILTALVAEVYRADQDRDDVALYNTLLALQSRLAANREVTNPTDATASLTAKPKFKAQMRSLVKRLDKYLDVLAVITSSQCTHERALRAWGRFFDHAFWTDAADAHKSGTKVPKADVAQLRLSVGIATGHGAPTTPYHFEQRPIPKKRMIHFKVPDEWIGVPGARFRWLVTNTGDEAAEADDVEYELDGGTDVWRVAAYRGIHTMTCEVIQDEQVVARGTRRVRVARW